MMANEKLPTVFQTIALDPLARANPHPRLDQLRSQRPVMFDILSVIEDEAAREALRQAARDRQGHTDEERSPSHEAGVLMALCDLASKGAKSSFPLADVTDFYARSHSRDLLHPISGRWIGAILRRRFGLRTRKSHSVYVLALPDARTLNVLRCRYGITDIDIAHLKEFDVAEVLRVEPIEGADGSPANPAVPHRLREDQDRFGRAKSRQEMLGAQIYGRAVCRDRKVGRAITEAPRGAQLMKVFNGRMAAGNGAPCKRRTA